MDWRFTKMRGLMGRLRGPRGGAYRLTRESFSAVGVIAASIVLFAVFFALRMLDDEPSAGYALLFVLPISLLALRFGTPGGLIGAVVAEVLFVVAAVTVVDYEGILPYLTRAATFLTLGLVVGHLSTRLAQNEARFVTTLRSAPIYVFMMDRDLRYTWVYEGWNSREAVELLGLHDEELLGPEHAAPFTEIKRRVLESGESETAELPVRIPDEADRWFRLSVEPTKDATGRVVGLTGSALEITEVRAAYDEVARNEERFRSAVENMLEPFALFSAIRDGDGRIVDFHCDYINQPGADSVGLKAADMRGGLLSELFPGRLEYGLIDRYRDVVESGEPHVREEVDYVDVFGERTLVRGFDIRVAKVGDGVEITWRDITARKRDESDRDWSAAIVDASIDAIMSADLDGAIRSWSRGAELLYGWSSEEIVGRRFMDVLLPDHSKPARAELFDRVTGGESVGPVRAVEKHRDGRVLDITFTATPMRDEDGTITGVARIVRPTAVSVVESVPEGDGPVTSAEAPS